MREICMSGSMSGMWKRVMVEPLRHRQTKEAATDMFSLQPPRHIPTLPHSVALGQERGPQRLLSATDDCGSDAAMTAQPLVPKLTLSDKVRVLQPPQWP